MRNLLNDFLTNELKYKGKVTMTTEYAWKHADAVEVISYLSNKECAILGGDVLNSNLGYTHDNWSYTYNHSLSLENNVSESVSKAIEYIDWYNKKFGDDFYYIIVAMKRTDYLSMQRKA